MRTNYVLIDYEKVQPTNLGILDGEHFKVIVFVGANQTKVNVDIALGLQRMGSNASYVKISGNGSNALDFHISYYIGLLSATEADAYFHIISKDAGFDPLIAHLKSRKIFACRSKDISDIPLVKAANTKSQPEKVAFIVANLKQRGASRPRTVKTLSSTISSLFQKALNNSEIQLILKQLETNGHLAIVGEKVSYSLT